MQNEDIKAAMKAKMNQLPILDLLGFIMDRVSKFDAVSEVIVELGMEVASERMGETEFVRFCGQLEASL